MAMPVCRIVCKRACIYSVPKIERRMVCGPQSTTTTTTYFGSITLLPRCMQTDAIDGKGRHFGNPFVMQYAYRSTKFTIKSTKHNAMDPEQT